MVQYIHISFRALAPVNTLDHREKNSNTGSPWVFALDDSGEPETASASFSLRRRRGTQPEMCGSEGVLRSPFVGWWLVPPVFGGEGNRSFGAAQGRHLVPGFGRQQGNCIPSCWTKRFGNAVGWFSLPVFLWMDSHSLLLDLLFEIQIAVVLVKGQCSLDGIKAFVFPGGTN